MKKCTANKLIKGLNKLGKSFLIFVFVFVWIFSDWLNFLPSPFPEIEKVYAAGTPGEVAVYREATAGDAITTANFDNDWDTTVREDSSFSLVTPANTNIQLLSGHYAVMYGIRFDSTGGTKRSEVQSQLNLNGTDIPIGWSHGYTNRNSGANELFTAGGGIIDVATDNDALIVQSFRTDANTASGIGRVSGSAGMSLLKLDDTWDYIRLSRTIAQAGPTSATWVDVQYDSQEEYDTGSFTHSTVTNNNNITLDTVGHYLVFANTYGAISGSSDRTLVRQRLTLGGTEIDGTLTTVYIRGDSNGNSTQEGSVALGTIIETTAASQILNVEVNRGDGTTPYTINEDDVGTYVNRSGLTIVKLPDTADYIRLNDSGADDMNPATLGFLGWNTEDEIDTDSFTHSTVTNDNRITVNAAEDYLFLTTNYAVDAGVAHGLWNQGWRKNSGSLLTYGQSGNFNRDLGAIDTGNWSGVIFDSMAANDYIEVVTQQLGASGVIADDVQGIQGVNIDSLFNAATIVTATGTQDTTINIPSTNDYIGASFVIPSTRGSRNVTAITIAEHGSVDALNDLGNIKLYYELDTSAPYDCAGMTYDGSPVAESQFGSTDTTGFSAADGTSAFSGTTVGISPTATMCVYVVLDVLSSAGGGDTLDIRITNPSTDITLSAGTPEPVTAVLLDGQTTLNSATLSQNYYHFRNDDNTEALATSATGGENTVLDKIAEGVTTRLRMEVSNIGNVTASATTHTLQYSEKISSCDVIADIDWVNVGPLEVFRMSDSTYLTNGDETTDIALGIGGVTNDGTFKTPNYGVLDTSNVSSSITLSSTEFVELEYSIEATINTVDNTTYCFRLSNIDDYSVYPEATFDEHIVVSSLDTQIAAIDIPTSSKYVGGMFVISDSSTNDTHAVTSIKIK